MSVWENYVRRVTPYVPGEQPKRADIVKLNTNENPYPPSPKVAEALRGMTTERMRRYPDPEARILVEAIAAEEGVSPEQIFVGVGSDDVLAMAFQTFFQSGKPILFPDITYSFYDVWAELFRIPYERVPLSENFEIVPADYARENGGVIFPNPNAPTGALLPLAAIRSILEQNRDVVVMVDEAYIDFGGETCTGLLPEFENLLVVKTFSKSRSMAGMRIGYAIGNAKLIQYLKDVKFSFNSYTMSEAALILGTAAAQDHAYFEETRQKIIATRERAKMELAALGFSFPDSKSNFLFVTHESVPAARLFAMLKENGIYVRYFNKPRIDNYLRITIGTDAEMEKLYACLRGYLSAD